MINAFLYIQYIWKRKVYFKNIFCKNCIREKDTPSHIDLLRNVQSLSIVPNRTQGIISGNIRIPTTEALFKYFKADCL